MSAAAELLDRIALQVSDVRRRLDEVQSSHPKSHVIQQALELHASLSRGLTDAQRKLGRNELTNTDAGALADRIESGMQQMIAMISSDQTEHRDSLFSHR